MLSQISHLGNKGQGVVEQRQEACMVLVAKRLVLRLLDILEQVSPFLASHLHTHTPKIWFSLTLSVAPSYPNVGSVATSRESDE